MKERPILFSAPMVRALLDDSKSQTRRVVKLPGLNYVDGGAPGIEFDGFRIPRDCGPAPARFSAEAVGGGAYLSEEIFCPYGEPDDRLRVRETFYAYGRWMTRYSEKKRRDEWHFIDMTVECGRRYQYDADSPDVPLATGRGGALPGWYKRPAIFMPRAACRIELEITGVRVERLNDISEADADAEGCERLDSEREVADWTLCDRCGGTRLHRALGPNGGVIEDVDCVDCDTYAKRYKHLWESINGAGSWAANPFVWVIEFKRAAS
ncbi:MULTISPECIES: hypothetical protein [unclassified Duganella]|uniref:hypothetical protein n=1 Tax=unclassified Duganella TaxID=2636909 RepID=UPI000881A60D|nr:MULTISPECIES: hypothetical protein [unclassified Duganella]SDF79445.1 hypothetical protein SAMN05216320_1011345 [Duganella sp. OV458]SDI49675.1 hypothetical protein SAMN05428973_10170 [Duganella sp. OV510]